MAISRGETKNYVVANGSVEFNQIPQRDGKEYPEEAKGFRYLGSSTEMNLTQENEILEHKSSECGFNTTDEEIITSSSLTGALTVDNISSENLAMFFAGAVTDVVQTAETGKSEVFKVYPELGYQLGTTKDNPNGVFAVANVKVEVFADETAAKAGTAPTATLVKDSEFEINEAMGYLTIGDIQSTKNIKTEGSWVKVTYDLTAKSRQVVISKGTSIVGALRFKGCNAKGENRTYFLPKVRLKANGDFALKGGEEFTTMAFDITALKDGEKPSLYINGQPR